MLLRISIATSVLLSSTLAAAAQPAPDADPAPPTDAPAPVTAPPPTPTPTPTPPEPTKDDPYRQREGVPFAFADFSWAPGAKAPSESPLKAGPFAGELRLDVA